MESGPLDGSLYAWEDVAGEYPWDTLLLGNGLSINIWPDFGYAALFDYAEDLSPTDRLLFEDTPNFERVLADLRTTIWVDSVCGVKTDQIERRYRRVQEGLGNAVRAVHLERHKVPDRWLVTVRKHLLDYGWVFTTSYDLLLYWAMGASPGGRFAPFMDLFRYGGRCQFDPERSDVPSGRIAVYFLHGALHLVVGGRGETWKLTWSSETLLDQFGQPIPDEPHARPLLVTEGSARDKIQAIDANVYLRHALDRLRQRDSPAVVFGSSLSTSDQHLVDALNEHPGRPVAVSLHTGTKRQLAAKQRDIFDRLLAEPLLFFDSTTHPLGSPLPR